jgi:hypothetical protein
MNLHNVVAVEQLRNGFGVFQALASNSPLRSARRTDRNDPPFLFERSSFSMTTARKVTIAQRRKVVDTETLVFHIWYLSRASHAGGSDPSSGNAHLGVGLRLKRQRKLGIIVRARSTRDSLPR